MKELTQPIGGEAVETGARVRYAANPFWDELMMETKRKRTTLKGRTVPRLWSVSGQGRGKASWRSRRSMRSMRTGS